MKLVDISQATGLMYDVLSDSGMDNKVYLSATVWPVHKQLVEELARQNRTKQADVMRAIIDEWCRYRLADTERLDA